MSGPFSDLTETLFEEKSVLSESYQPDKILERDEEIEGYRYALQDVLFGREPDNVMLYGKAGLGKTAVTKYMMDALQKEVSIRDEADELFVHDLNCNGKTLFMIIRRLVNELLPDSASPFPKRGLGTGDAFDELYKQLDRHGGTHLLVFDELDHLDDADTLLYELPRAQANKHIVEAQIGVIGISNNYTFRNSLSSKVRDTLMEREISFRPYHADELRTILNDRAKRAFAEGSWDDSAVAMAAAIAAKDQGNARQAIDLLRTGAEIADRTGDDCIRDDHVENARELVQRGRLKTRIQDQTDHAQYILETMAYLEKDYETPARSKTIKTNYETVAESWGAEPLSTLKSIQKHLSDLQMLGFLNRRAENKGRKGGHYYEYQLDLDAEIILETRDELEGQLQ
ncbi:orc1/cdc6 family replication initiation protein [Halostagnicola sp. A-GB9-2]|uniref:orc1/cdc6 family replication initiation protein n=1 Tax=Halostagnicola sp. A-GB9-2 TaxID=3048066 RepID=UPI0024C0A744|nr:orc1/cdc6 family replication initiation protein [Halostagnicola sp. A-GB9-2]MDJ1434796.1 orc1/cdc6 family replication initiation protein [Halostagnicola sp. A-GB9-2]